MRLLATFQRSAFRLETRDTYALGYEAADFERFLAGSPSPPPELDWWRPWLDQISRLTRRRASGISRVRVLAEPPERLPAVGAVGGTVALAGRRAHQLHAPQQGAGAIGLPLVHDWWLLDDERLIIMAFTDDGEIDQQVTDRPIRTIVPAYRIWRDLAVRNATPAEEIAAA